MTADELHKIADASYPLRVDKINRLLARCKIAAQEGSYSTDTSTDEDPTLLNEKEKAYLQACGFNFLRRLVFQSKDCDAMREYITW